MRNSVAICEFDRPAAHAKTIRARWASPCAVVRRRAHCSSVVRSLGLIVTRTVGRPRRSPSAPPCTRGTRDTENSFQNIRSGTLAIVALAVGAGIISVHAQNIDKWTPPRTPWGDPDLQGLWPGTESLGIPLQRDPKLGTRNELTEQEFEDRRRQAQQAVDDMEAEFDLATADTSKAGQVGSATSPPPHWQERGTPSRQASLIVDPPDGRIPALTPQSRARYDAIQAARKNRGPADW